jgi:hypothetical protein
MTTFRALIACGCALAALAVPAVSWGQEGSEDTRTATALVADPAILILTPLELRAGNLYAHLSGADTHAPIAGAIVEFSAGGTFICADDTDETGTAHCDGLIPAGLAAILNLGYSAAFKGTVTYKPSAATGTLLGPGGPI